MRGLDIIGADPALGLSWGDVGDASKAAFPYVHATGKGVASAFGAGAAADALESVEKKQGWLPASSPAAASTVATTAQSVATAATPKLHPAAPKTSPKTNPTDGKSAADVSTKSPQKLNFAALGVFGGLFALALLLLRGRR